MPAVFSCGKRFFFLRPLSRPVHGQQKRDEARKRQKRRRSKHRVQPENVGRVTEGSSREPAHAEAQSEEESRNHPDALWGGIERPD